MSTFEPISFPKMPKKEKKEIKGLIKSLYQNFCFRRTIRNFSKRPISEEAIQNCIKVATIALSGANHQPWHFIAVSNKKIKKNIRYTEEIEEKKVLFYF